MVSLPNHRPEYFDSPFVLRLSKERTVLKTSLSLWFDPALRGTHHARPIPFALSLSKGIFYKLNETPHSSRLES
jgi:hypothetical protein